MTTAELITEHKRLLRRLKYSVSYSSGYDNTRRKIKSIELKIILGAQKHKETEARQLSDFLLNFETFIAIYEEYQSYERDKRGYEIYEEALKSLIKML